LCECRGWRTSENEDWIKVDDRYHNFLWAMDIRSTSFKRIVANRKCVVQEGLSYRVVEAAYTAWLFSKAPSEDLVRTVLENPEFYGRIALYDLSPLLDGKNMCVKVNNTDSPVFQEFESFLQDELKVRVEPFPPLFDVAIGTDDCAVSTVA